jgi:hypothetical protein
MPAADCISKKNARRNTPLRAKQTLDGALDSRLRSDRTRNTLRLIGIST